MSWINSSAPNWTDNADKVDDFIKDKSFVYVGCHGTRQADYLTKTTTPKKTWGINEAPLHDDILNPFLSLLTCETANYDTNEVLPEVRTSDVEPWAMYLASYTNNELRGPIGTIGCTTESFEQFFMVKSIIPCRFDSNSYNTWGSLTPKLFDTIYHISSNLPQVDYVYCGDPSASWFKQNPSTSEVASASSISVSANSVTASTGSIDGTIRISAYAPNTGWDSTTTISSEGTRTFYSSDRPLFIAFTKDDASKTPTVWTTGGSLSVDTWIIGKVRVNGDLTVQSGKTMEVLYGTEMTFKANTDDRASGEDTCKSELIIAGTLKADNATFKSTSKGDWYGIRFQSTASSSSYLKDCTIENAKYAVCVNASDPTIEECSIKSASWYGVYVTGSGAWPVVDDNYIEADTFAVYLANCGSDGGNYKFNSFKTAKYGIYISSGSPNFIDGGNGSDGHNKWETSIVQHRVYVSGGYGYFGFDEDPGNNYFTKPDSSTYKYIYNGTRNTVYAANNYFSQCPDPDTAWFYGSVYRANKLGSPPSSPAAGPSWSLPKESSEYFKRLLAAKNEVHEKGMAGVKEELIALVDEYKREEYAALALDILLGNTASAEMAEFNRQLLNDTSVPVNLKFVVDKWNAIHRYEGGDYRFDPALKYKHTPFENEMIVINAFGLAGNGLKEEAVALVRNKIKGEESSLIGHLVWALHMQEPYSMGGSLAKTATTPEMAVGSYPNPFNSETRIGFCLPYAEEVSVTIYNYLGQRVKTLWRGEKESGRHEILWDGRNDSGDISGSGIYFCRIVAGNKSHLLKLLMIK